MLALVSVKTEILVDKYNSYSLFVNKAFACKGDFGVF